MKLVIEVNADSYWRQPFQTICNPKQLREFTIMDIEEADNRHVYGKESAKVCLKNLRKHNIIILLNYQFIQLASAG